MNIRINYGTGVATLPTAALTSMERATKADIKVLFLLCAEPTLLNGESRDACISRICEQAGYAAGQIESSLAFWRGAGVLDMEGGEVPETAANVPTASPSPVGLPTTAGVIAPPVPEVQDSTAEGSAVTVTRSKTRLLDEIPNYTPDELEKFLSEKSQSSKFLNECQTVWEDIFTPREFSIVITLVDTWGFQWDYVISLLAYVCKQFKAKENQGKSLNYVYRMAMNLHKEGILTYEALQQRFVEYDRMNDFERRIRAMFGLGERNLTPKEKKYFSTWLYEYHYDIEIVEHAYNITVDAKGAPNMNYTNGILKHWYEDGLGTLEEIIAKRSLDNAVIKELKEGVITPDNCLEIMDSHLNGREPKPSEVLENHRNLSQDINILRRLMNLGNRMLTEGETAAFTKWREEFDFHYEIIYYAYQITVENRKEYSLPYMDAILTKWHEQKLTTMEAIKAYEKGYKEDKQRKKVSPTAPSTARDSTFDTGDFFMAAVKRSFGDDFDPAIFES